MGLAAGEHVVVGRRLLQHQPHPLDIIARMSLVAPGIQVAEVKLLPQSDRDHGGGARDLPGHKGLAANRALVIEQDTVGDMEAIGLAVVHRDPASIKFGVVVGAARLEGRGFVLRGGEVAVEFGARGLVEADPLFPGRGYALPRAGAECRACRRWPCIPASRSSPARGFRRPGCRSCRAALVHQADRVGGVRHVGHSAGRTGRWSRAGPGRGGPRAPC